MERYTQFTHGGKLPASYDFWRRQAPMLHGMSFDEIVANDMVILGNPETVADTILRIAGQLDLTGLAMIFKLGAMPYDMVERSMTTFGKEVMPRIQQVLDRTAASGRRTGAAHRLKQIIQDFREISLALLDQWVTITVRYG